MFQWLTLCETTIDNTNHIFEIVVMACVLAPKWKETICQNTLLNSDCNVAIFIIK